MADMVLIQGAIAGLKTAADIAIGLGKLHTMTEVQAKAIELQQIILSAQSSALSAQSEQFSFLEQIRALKEEVASVKAWETEKQRYKLSSPWEGAVTYTLKESMANGEPAHWICTSCYENGRKSILNPVKGKDTWYLLICPVCNSQIQSPWRNAAHPTYAPE
jgi:hypothetical protein